MEFFMTRVSKSGKSKILGYLSKPTGYNTLTVAKSQSTFGIKNVAARVDELRKEGHAIYTNAKTVNGKKVTFYRMGTPTRKVVAAGVEYLRLRGEKAFG